MKKFMYLAASSLVLMSAPALAQSNDAGVYVRGNVGYGTHTDTEFDTSIFRGEMQSEGGVTGSVGLGYDFGQNLRLELDADTMFTQLGKIDNQPSSYAKLRTNSLMMNAIYDFDSYGKIVPYVGVGAGVVEGTLKAQASDFVGPNNTLVTNPACLGGQSGYCVIDDTDTAFGYQAMAGVGYEVTENLTWDTHYTYQAVEPDGFDYDGYFGPNNSAVPALQRETELNDVASHTIMTGFRYRFGASSPSQVTCWDGSMAKSLANCPVQPQTQTCWNGSEIPVGQTCPPEPVATKTCWDGTEIPETQTCPAEPQYTCWDGSVVMEQSMCPVQASLCEPNARQEIIYYEFDKAASAETRNKISTMLDVGQNCNINSISVVGHTDTSGSRAYNQGLSERRAQDATDELARQGVNPAIVSSEGRGETQPAVETGDGVREQLNRRTEVLMNVTEINSGNIN